MTRSFENLAPDEVAILLTACGTALAAVNNVSSETTSNHVFKTKVQLVITIDKLTKAIS